MEFMKFKTVTGLQIASDGSGCRMQIVGEDGTIVGLDVPAEAIDELWGNAAQAKGMMANLKNGSAHDHTNIVVDVASASYKLEPMQVTLFLHQTNGLDMAVPVGHQLLTQLVEEGRKILQAFRPVAPHSNRKQ